MKRLLITLLLLVTMSFNLIGCGGGDTTPTSTPDSTPEVSSEAERRCMECQIGFLKTIGAPEYMTEYLRSLIDNKTDYFSDYKNRNW